MNDKQQKKTALYCRLSVDDGRLGESISIESQKILLVQYCKDHAIKNYEIYDDDGFSGTNAVFLFVRRCVYSFRQMQLCRKTHSA